MKCWDVSPRWHFILQQGHEGYSLHLLNLRPFRKSHFLINRLSGFVRTCDQGLGSFFACVYKLLVTRPASTQVP